MRLANIRNGLAFPHDDVCYFASTHGHQASIGYFRIDAMPYKAVIRLLQGGSITIIDATQHDKPLSDALKFGVPTWCLVFNRALRRPIKVCSWQTREMPGVAGMAVHKPLVQTIRKLVGIYGHNGPVEIGRNVVLECHRQFEADDRPELLSRMVLSEAA